MAGGLLVYGHTRVNSLSNLSASRTLGVYPCSFTASQTKACLCNKKGVDCAGIEPAITSSNYHPAVCWSNHSALVARLTTWPVPVTLGCEIV